MTKSDWQIEAPTESTLASWVAMRHALWSETTEKENLRETQSMLADSSRFFVRIALSAEATPAGFVEASLRSDYVNGCESSPAAFLEGIYVEPWARLQGAARAMVEATAAWARKSGCTEFASDALLENEESHRMHVALGFKETERVVYFRKPLTQMCYINI